MFHGELGTFLRGARSDDRRILAPMKEPQALRDVAQFHRTFGLPVVSAPAPAPEERARLRVNLLREELRELEEAIAEDDMLEIADALADLQYVLSGAVLEFGLGKVFGDLFEEVHRSNMSKACRSLEEAEQTRTHYRDRQQDARIEKRDGQWLVYRNDDGKVLKNINYSPADLTAKLG